MPVSTQPRAAFGAVEYYLFRSRKYYTCRHDTQNMVEQKNEISEQVLDFSDNRSCHIDFCIYIASMILGRTKIIPMQLERITAFRRAQW